MTDITSIAAALNSLKTLTDIAKIIKESGSTLEKAEVKLKMAELISGIADVKIQLADVNQLVLDKDNKIKELENQLSLKEKVEWEAPYYWVKENEKRDGPFCQRCRDNDSKLIRLQKSGDGVWTCKVCTNVFKDKNYVAGSGIVNLTRR